MKRFVCLLFIVVCYVVAEAQEGYDYEPEQDDYFEEEQSLPPLLRTRRQLFGGRSGIRSTGISQQIGYQHGRTWGALSQSSKPTGRVNPMMYSGGSGFGLPGGHSISGSIDHVPKFGSQASVRGDVNLFSNDRHKVSAFGQHDRTLNRSFRPVGQETNSAGLNYAHANGATAFISGSRTPGQPARGSAGGTIPIANLGNNARVDAYGKTNFGHGMKPVNEGGVQVSASF